MSKSVQWELQGTPAPRNASGGQGSNQTTNRSASLFRRYPWWVWAVGATALTLILSLLLLLALRQEAGWTLVINGAPTGSDVFVDNVRRGVTLADGTIHIPDLRAGRRTVRITRDGYEDFVTAEGGEDGDLKTVLAQLPLVSVPITLSEEVNYNGAMRLVAGGDFVMGNDTGEADERPAHTVSLPDFYIDKYEVTNADYKRFCDATQHPYPLNPWWTKESLNTEDYFNQFPDSPVIGISWNDAAAYAAWAGKRLPTEQEWEKAASWSPGPNPTKRLYPWGDAADRSRANLLANAPVPVTQFATGASAYGVYNLAGNVSEWVDSYYQSYPGNPTADANYGTRFRVVRGGTFQKTVADARTTRRSFEPPTYQTQPTDEQELKASLIGFRCAVTANDPRLQRQLQQSPR